MLVIKHYLFSNSVANFLNKWMVTLWDDHYLLLLGTYGNDVVTPFKSIFYHRLVDDINGKQKLRDNILFHQLNNYHRNIKFTIEVNPIKF